MSARNPTARLPCPARSTPTTPVPPTPVWTSIPQPRSVSATRAAVRCSAMPSSGWACRSRRMAVRAAWSRRMWSRADMGALRVDRGRLVAPAGAGTANRAAGQSQVRPRRPPSRSALAARQPRDQGRRPRPRRHAPRGRGTGQAAVCASPPRPAPTVAGRGGRGGGGGGSGRERRPAQRPVRPRQAAKSARACPSVAGYRPMMERPPRTSSITKSS